MHLLKDLGIRTPIREAIRALVDYGVLETRPRKGSFVRILNAKQLFDLFQVAAELEGMACRLASLSLTECSVKAIGLELAKCKKAAEKKIILSMPWLTWAFILLYITLVEMIGL